MIAAFLLARLEKSKFLLANHLQLAIDFRMSEESSENKATEEEFSKQEKPVGEDPVSDEEIERELEEAAAQEQLSEEEKVAEELGQWKDKAIRAAAELENYRKRMAREKADSIRFGNQNLLSALLPVIDNFNMGMMAAEQDSGSMIYMGMQMVQKQMNDFLNEQGVTEVPITPGDGFDPNSHEAMSQEESDEIAEGCIIRVMRKGYKIGDRLLRPANVVVSGKEKEEDAESVDVEEAAAE